MILRKYEPSDLAICMRLFYETVHTVNAKDYTQEQRDVWATGKEDSEEWNRSFLLHHTIIAQQDDRIVGFGDVDETGYIDRLFVEKEHQGQGIGSAILHELEEFTQGDNVVCSSITARPFFEKNGYLVLRKQQVVRQGISLTCYWMKKSREI